jgi:transposase
MSRPFGTADELERRRLRAVQAVLDGQPRKTVAQVLGVHLKTVSRWVQAGNRMVSTPSLNSAPPPD